MDAFTISTLGTWARGEDRLVAAPDGALVALSNRLGQSWTVSEREWLERWDGLRDGGWLRAS